MDINKLLDSLFDAIIQCFQWFDDLYLSVNMYWIAMGLVVVALVSRFLLLPFFGGIVNVGVSDSVQRVTRTGRHSQGYKNQQAFYKSKSAYYDRKVQNYYNSKRK